MIEAIANELLLASDLLKTNNVSRIAGEIGYRPLLIINALNYGDDNGKLTWNKKRDTLTPGEGVEVASLSVSEGVSELRDQIEMFMGYTNRRETDMTIDELGVLLGGTPELHIKMAIATSPLLATYELTAPKDKKSVYTFVSLKENADKQWGKKQLVPKKKKGDEK